MSLQDAIGTIVQGNFIGTNAAGTASFGQRGPYGIQARNSTDTQILDNLISGILVVGTNHYAGQRFGIGISLQGNDAGTVIRGNLIGTDASGQSAVPNRTGIATSFWPGSSSAGPATIGGTNEGEGNTIAFNETIGVSVDFSSRGVRISGNSIDSNGGLGIDLIAQSGGGVTPNDLGDSDDGGNGLQNFPVIQSALTSAGGTTVSGNLNSLPNSQFSLEFFASPQCDPSGFGEGASFLGSVTVTTDSAGNAPFQAGVAPTAVGSAITATATHLPTGQTSEFSACQLATGSSAPPLQLLSAVSRKAQGGAGSFDLNLPLSGTPAVESRSSGDSHTLVFTFNNNVMSGSATIESGTGNCAAKVFSGNTMVATVTGASDVQMLSIVLSGVTDQYGQVLPDTHISVGLLVGDVNGDGIVNSGDTLQTRSRSGQSVDASNFRADVNLDGAVNSGDALVVRARSGSSLP